MNLQKASSANGTSLQGYVRTTLADLIKVLGEPHMYEGDKTTVEWAFQYGDAVFTIYDYKTYGTPKNEYEWHVGGYDSSVLQIVQALFPNNIVKR
jgi:hypothetical protein